MQKKLFHIMKLACFSHEKCFELFTCLHLLTVQWLHVLLILLPRDGEKIDLYTYAQCNNIGCGCQYSADSYQERIKTCHSPAITLRLLAGCYHNRCEELLQVVTRTEISK